MIPEKSPVLQYLNKKDALLVRKHEFIYRAYRDQSMKKILAFLALAAVLAILPGCTQKEPVQPLPPPSLTATPTPPEIPVQLSPTQVQTPLSQGSVSDNTIHIKKYVFDPPGISVRAGSTVRWVNEDSVPHRILFEDMADSSVLSSQQSYSRKFDRAGTYNYSCTIHPGILGTVTVE